VSLVNGVSEFLALRMPISCKQQRSSFMPAPVLASTHLEDVSEVTSTCTPAMTLVIDIPTQNLESNTHSCYKQSRSSP